MTNFAKILSEASDHSVVKLPYREFPSITFQGDSLFIFYMNLSKLSNYINNKEIFMEEIAELKTELREILDDYKFVLRKNGYKIPFNDCDM